MDFSSLLKLMVHKGGSDLFITAGMPPSMKVNGRIKPVSESTLTPEQAREAVLPFDDGDAAVAAPDHATVDFHE